MNMTRIRFIQAFILCLCIAGGNLAVAQEYQWAAITGDDLREFMSDLTVERVAPDGSISRAVYTADGKGVLFKWGVKFSRRWELDAEDRVCFISYKNRDQCSSIEKSNKEPNLYRVYDDIAGQWFEFHVVEHLAIVKGKTPRRGDKGGPAAASASEIAAELTNPNTTLGILTTLYDYKTFAGSRDGASSQSAQSITFQPSLPYPLGEGKNLFFRPAFPLIIEQPVIGATGEFEDSGVEFGDISYDASMGFSFTIDSGKNVFLAGISGSIPTATDKTVGTDQWLLGPELGFTAVRKWGSAGLLVYHQWDVAGEDSFDTNLTGGQYVYNINLRDGWQITGSPTFSYDHNADSNNAMTLPLAVGVAKTLIFYGRPWTMSVEYWNFIESPDDFGPEHQVRLSIAPIVPLPW